MGADLMCARAHCTLSRGANFWPLYLVVERQTLATSCGCPYYAPVQRGCGSLRMIQTTTQPSVDTAFGVMRLEPVGPVSPDERRAFEHTQWIAARGSAARILGALADGVTPTAASLATGVTMAPSLLANFCEFIALTHAGLDPVIGREHVGQLRADGAASAIELCAKEKNRARGLARILRSGRKLDYLWFAKLAAYNPEATRSALQPVIATWTGISFERIYAARKLLPTLTAATPLREAGHVAGYLLAGEVPQLATLEPLDIYLEDGGHVLPPKS